MLKKLEDKLRDLKKVAIAFSGGIDSTFLLYVANSVLGKDNVLAIIANGSMIPKLEYEDATKYLKKNQFNYKEILYNPLDIIEFKENRIDRCYYCKKNLMTKIKMIGKKNGFDILLDGKNADDLKGYRPGSKAVEEIGILSPLADLNFDKASIRNYSKSLKIKGWDKPSNSCLATRFPYNTILTDEGLKKIDISEEIIKQLGIKNVRVRAHYDIARIEVENKDFQKILSNCKIIEEIKKVGFNYITLDLSGLRSGSFDV